MRELWPLGLLLAFTLVAVLGYGIYGLHPERLPSSPLFVGIYRVSFPAFAKLHIALSAAVLFYGLYRAAGFRWLAGLVLVYAASFVAEYVGTGYGVPFGGYGYSNLLGTKIGGRVPVLIPLSWFVMAVPSFALARFLVPGSPARVGRILVAALLLVSWDLALDPAMSDLTPYWSWEQPGPYYGMPLENLAGWLITSLVIMGIMEAVGGARWTASLGFGWSAAFYGLVLLMPLGMCVAAGYWLVPILTFGALGASVGLGSLLGGPGEEPGTLGRTVEAGLEVDGEAAPRLDGVPG